MSAKAKVVVLTGAGISAESGLLTFRDAGGLWEGHKVEEVATPEAFARNPQLVLDFYNQRRAQLQQVAPTLHIWPWWIWSRHTMCTSLPKMWMIYMNEQAAATFCICTVS